MRNGEYSSTCLCACPLETGFWYGRRNRAHARTHGYLLLPVAKGQKYKVTTLFFFHFLFFKKRAQPLKHVHADKDCFSHLHPQPVDAESSRGQLSWFCFICRGASKGPQKRDTFVVAVAILAMQFVEPHPDVGPLLSCAQGRVTHAAAETMDVVIQIEGLNDHSSAVT